MSSHRSARIWAHKRGKTGSLSRCSRLSCLIASGRLLFSNLYRVWVSFESVPAF